MTDEVKPSLEEMTRWENEGGAVHEEQHTQDTPSKQDLRKYSKRFFPDERTKEAQSIHDIRKEFSKLEPSTQRGEASSATTRVDTQNQTVHAETEAITALKDQLAAYKSNVRNRVIHAIDIWKLEAEIKNREAALSGERELSQIYQQQLEHRQQKLQQTETKVSEIRGRAQASLDQFYDEMATKYEEDKDYLSVKELLAKENAVMLHGFSKYPINVEESLARVFLRNDERFSTLTVREGDTGRNIYSPFGVIITGGEYISAHPYDVSSDITGLAEKDSTKRPSEQVPFAINARPDETYNEFNVRSIDTAGVYVCLDPAMGYRNFNDQYAKPEFIESVVPTIESYGIPMYALENGEIFEAEYDPEERKIKKKGDPIPPAELTQRRFTLNNDAREKLKEVTANSSSDTES